MVLSFGLEVDEEVVVHYPKLTEEALYHFARILAFFPYDSPNRSMIVDSSAPTSSPRSHSALS